MKKIICLLIISFTLSACTTIEEQTRVATNLQVKEYNSMASGYMDRPTFASIMKMSDGETVLHVKMDTYGIADNSLSFAKSSVSEYLAIILKYMEWEALAQGRGDAITKDIGTAPTWGNGFAGSLKFTFHSGNARNHYLSVSFCVIGTCLDEDSFYFDRKNAMELAALLKDMESGVIKQINVDDVYQ